MSTTNVRLLALALALPALTQAQALELQGDAVQPQPASDPSGNDDMKRLADAEQQALHMAAAGRAGDALRYLRSAYPDTFSQVAAEPQPAPPADPNGVVSSAPPPAPSPPPPPSAPADAPVPQP